MPAACSTGGCHKRRCTSAQTPRHKTIPDFLAAIERRGHLAQIHLTVRRRQGPAKRKIVSSCVSLSAIGFDIRRASSVARNPVANIRSR
jgi:hypothetical protein